MTEPTHIRVDTAAPYDVVVGRGVVDRVGPLAAGTRAAVIHPHGLPAIAAEVVDRIAATGTQVMPIVVPDGESAKSATVAAACWQALGRAGFTRSDIVVGVGGGATTDLAGFVAATFLRGIGLVLVPTTLLGMVDAAVGGKTGIDTGEGKNLVGAFHEPRGVLCDLGLLAGLPARELRSGLAEVVKCGFIADPTILDLVERSPRRAVDPTSEVVRDLVERAVTVKARVVSADLREATSSGSEVGRESLNYGHTLGHAVELVEGYTLRHGEAVAIGMVFVAEVARRLGTIDADVQARHRRVLDLVGLPTTYRADAWDALLPAMRRDKKARGTTLRLVLLEGLARPTVVEATDERLLEDAYLALSADRAQ